MINKCTVALNYWNKGQYMLPAPVRKKTIKFLKDWFIALITFNLTLNNKKR
jgi:hypothetical protein